VFHEKKKNWYYSYEVGEKNNFLELVEIIVRKVGKHEQQLREFMNDCYLNFEHVGIKWFQITINEQQMILDGIRNDKARVCFMDRIRGKKEKTTF